MSEIELREFSSDYFYTVITGANGERLVPTLIRRLPSGTKASFKEEVLGRVQVSKRPCRNDPDRIEFDVKLVGFNSSEDVGHKILRGPPEEILRKLDYKMGKYAPFRDALIAAYTAFVQEEGPIGPVYAIFPEEPEGAEE